MTTYLQQTPYARPAAFQAGSSLPQGADPLQVLGHLFGMHCQGGGFGPGHRMQMAMALMQLQHHIQLMLSQLLFGGLPCHPRPMPMPMPMPMPVPMPLPGGVPGAGDWLKPELPKICEGKWIAPHGGYKKLGEGRYLITKGEYKDHTLVHQGDGKFHVYDACGCLKGEWQSPAKKDKIASPLTFDLNGDGKVSTTAGGKQFDINGDGQIDDTAWAGKGDGVLAFDADGDGQVGESGLELFGNYTDLDGDGRADGHANGFEALRALAEREFGAVGEKLTAEQLQHLTEKYGLRMMVDGEQKTLAELGITEISLGYEEAGQNADEFGNEHRQVGHGFTQNGEQRAVNDVWFLYR